MTKRKKITILIPAYNEQDVLRHLYERLYKLAGDTPDYAFEFLFINDGSSDKTLEIIKTYAEKDARVAYINLSRNFGKETAMLAGLDTPTVMRRLSLMPICKTHPSLSPR